MPKRYWGYLFPGGTVYRRTDRDPSIVFATGWTRSGYEDLVTHITVDQGKGSNWIATTKDLTGMDERYGKYAFEIEIEWYQGVDANVAYTILTKHRNPHAEQNEVAVWEEIKPDQITAVWVPRPSSEVENPSMGKTWASYYNRYTRQEYLASH